MSTPGKRSIKDAKKGRSTTRGEAGSSGNAFGKIAAGLNEALEVARGNAKPSKLYMRDGSRNPQR